MAHTPLLSQMNVRRMRNRGWARGRKPAAGRRRTGAFGATLAVVIGAKQAAATAGSTARRDAASAPCAARGHAGKRARWRADDDADAAPRQAQRTRASRQ